jgi:hypothetical protein
LSFMDVRGVEGQPRPRSFRSGSVRSGSGALGVFIGLFVGFIGGVVVIAVLARCNLCSGISLLAFDFVLWFELDCWVKYFGIERVL